MCLAELMDVAGQLGLQVGSLVLVDDVCLSQFVQHLLDDGILLFSLGLVGSSTKLADGCTHVLCVVAVVQTTLLLLTDALDG